MTYLTVELDSEGWTVCAIWHGGAYIDLGPSLDGPFTSTINVWDYELDRPLIRFTFDSMVSAVLRHVREDEPLFTPESVQIGKDGAPLGRFSWDLWLDPALGK